MTPDGKCVTLSISNQFNEVFTNVGRNISESLPVPVNTNLKRCSDLLSPTEPFYFFPTTADEILKYINQLDHKKAAEMHGLPVICILKNGRRHYFTYTLHDFQHPHRQ